MVPHMSKTLEGHTETTTCFWKVAIVKPKSSTKCWECQQLLCRNSPMNGSFPQKWNSISVEIGLKREGLDLVESPRNTPFYIIRESLFGFKNHWDPFAINHSHSYHPCMIYVLPLVDFYDVGRTTYQFPWMIKPRLGCQKTSNEPWAKDHWKLIGKSMKSLDSS